MSIVSYAWGWVLLVGTLTMLGVAATRVTAVWFGDWDRSTRVLAGISLVLTWLFAVSFVLGTVGLFRTLPVYLIVNVGAVVTLVLAPKVGGRSTSHGPGPGSQEAAVQDPPKDDPQSEDPQSDGPSWLRPAIGLAAAVGTVVAVATSWLPGIAHSYRYGILEADSTWYHGHTIGRFLQTGWLTRITPVGTDSMVPFHPMNSEVLDALLIMPWQRDLVIPLATLAGLGLLFLAGWCIGAAWGRAPAGLVVTALMAGPATIRVSQPGSLKNDLLAAAFLAAGVALALHGWRRLPAVALSGVMLGLAVGTRTNLLLPAAIIVLAGLALLGLDHRRERRADGEVQTDREPGSPRWQVAVTWLGALALFGSYWYLRNWIRVGNPMPWGDLRLGPLHVAEVGHVRYSDTTIFYWRDNDDLISSAIGPGMRLAFGAFWWGGVLLGIMAVAMVFRSVIANLRSLWAGEVAGRRAMWITGLAVAGCLGVLGHVFTPLSLVVPPDTSVAPINIAINTRYVVPAFGLVLFAGVGATTSRRMELVFTVATLAVILQAAFPTDLYAEAPHRSEPADLPLTALLAVGLAVGLALAWAAITFRPHRGRPWFWPAGLVVVLIATIVLAKPALDEYLDRRYANQVSVHGADLWPVTRDLRDARIGMATTAVPYPYLGDDFSNEVFYIGVAEEGGLLRNARNCREWVQTLREHGFTHVALTVPTLVPEPPDRYEEWSLAVPGARVIHEQDRAALIALPTPFPEPTTAADC